MGRSDSIETEPGFTFERVADVPEAVANGRGQPWTGKLSEVEVSVLEALWVEGLRYAQREIGRYACWRGQDAPALPGGYDAEGVVQGAFERLLMRETGGVSIVYSVEELRAEVEKLIRRRVRWLHERRETGVLVSEWDVRPPGANGELVSLFDNLTGKSERPDEALSRRERVQLVEEARVKVEAGLEGKVREVFRRAWNGEKRREIARRMGERVERIKAVQAQIGRRLRRLGGTAGFGSRW